MKKPKKLLLLSCLVVFIGLCIIFVVNIPKIIGYTTAPKFQGLTYVSTTNDSLNPACIANPCRPTTHHYTAHGTEKVIAEQIIADLGKKGYRFEADGDDSYVVCGSSGQNISDNYQLYKPDDHFLHPPKMYINFQLPAAADDQNSEMLGCSRPEGTYNISIYEEAGSCIAAKSKDGACFSERDL